VDPPADEPGSLTGSVSPGAVECVDGWSTGRHGAESPAVAPEGEESSADAGASFDEADSDVAAKSSGS
jgi:hypothetical protein